ncbi:hypothetical protein IGS67_06150 [Flavimobilis sp. GY10621]|uniref:Pyrroline-5-carboxylate reductase catalytic N-terminal domain-containing protein n=1 Tax=Flavimobilis rhizosphaerae TaxID=2775421 RepID=A0ABR9DPN9_9MICO|nr:hypothetical protein [Flavimobilis rhizosphaerae]MBD9699079.1 hypothetical protein [Flavimobilis rhizosphaerae]
MTSFSIIGTGNMAQSIGGVLARGGASVQTVAHAETPALTGDVVVLAVPYPALADIVARAHELEAIGFLQLTLAASEKISWTAGFNLSR